MELPSARELELEVLLRERESQLANLKDEVLSLRQYLSTQPGPSTTDAVTLPPAVLSVLLPHIEAVNNNTATSVSATVAGGLNQRMRQLQEENDELYNLLKTTETGKLKDEVRSLRKAVAKLEGALKESHQAIYSLSEELEKTHETLMNSSRQKDLIPKPHSNSPRGPYRLEQTSSNSSKTNPSKPPPTGPRAYKRPRLSEPQASPPPPRPVAPLPPKPQMQNNFHSHPHSHTQNHAPMGPMRDHSRHSGSTVADNTKRHRPNQSEASTNQLPKTDVDEMDPSSKVPPPETVRERDRVRERERNNKDRERRDRETRDINPTSTNLGKPQTNNPTARRNGSNHSNTGRPGGGGGGATGTAGGSTGRRSVNTVGGSSSQSDYRTLQERMGL